MTAKTWFPGALGPAIMHALRDSFYIGGALSAVAAILSVLRGKRYAHPGNETLQGGNTESQSKGSASEKVSAESNRSGAAGLKVK